MDILRIGVIGAGVMGAAHAESIARIPEAELRAVADPHSAKAKELAEKYRAAALTDYLDLAHREDIDAVVVASPTPFHFFQARAAIEAGKPVYIEVPMTREREESDRLVELARERSVVVTAGHHHRAFLEMEEIRRQLQAGAVGKPGVIWLGRRTPHPQRWYSNFESSGGVAFDAMIHEFDFLLSCFGPVQRIFCQGMQGRCSTENMDYALAILRLESGAIAHIESSWSHYGQFLIDVEIAGDKGLIRYDNQESIPLKISMVDCASGARHYCNESPVSIPACMKTMQDFVKAARGEGSNPITAEEGRDAVRLAAAALESMKTKRPVTLRH
ncbi:MAG: Gfo/Idh/MocA family oxidoreductase [Candidatus Omnitrophota bacterium]